MAQSRTIAFSDALWKKMLKKIRQSEKEKNINKLVNNAVNLYLQSEEEEKSGN